MRNPLAVLNLGYKSVKESATIVSISGPGYHGNQTVKFNLDNGESIPITLTGEDLDNNGVVKWEKLAEWAGRAAVKGGYKRLIL